VWHKFDGRQHHWNSPHEGGVKYSVILYRSNLPTKSELVHKRKKRDALDTELHSVPLERVEALRPQIHRRALTQAPATIRSRSLSPTIRALPITAHRGGTAGGSPRLRGPARPDGASGSVRLRSSQGGQ
jgi:hypothetical protein